MRQPGASGRLCSERPLEARPTEGRLLRIMSQQGSSGSKDGNSHLPLGPAPGFDPTHGEKLSYCLSGISLEAACVPCLVPRAAIFSTAVPSIAAESSKIPPSLLLHTPSSRPLLVRPRLQLQPVWWPHWARFPLSSPALVLGSPNQTQMWSLKCQQRGKPTSLKLLAALSLLQSRTRSAFSAKSTSNSRISYCRGM